MNILNKLLQIKIDDEDKYAKIFSQIVKDIQNNKFSFNFDKIEKEDYYIILEDNRMNSYFVHVVPKQLWNLFKEIQKKSPDQILGFSVKAGEYKNKEVRVSCFGVKCNILGKSLFKLNQN